MKYRTKLYLSFIGTALFSSYLALRIVYFETERYLFAELQSKVISVAATTATQIDPELLKQITSKKDEGSPAYLQIQQVLRKARNANRRKDIFINYVYTLMPSKSNSTDIYFGVDAEEDPKNFSAPGDYDSDSFENHLHNHLMEPYSYGKLQKDRWGVWLTGYAPVLDREGNYVGTVAADITAHSVNQAMTQLLRFEVPALLGSMLLATLLAAYLSRRASKSLGILCLAAEEIGKGNLNYDVHLDTNDEFNEVAESITLMEKGLKERERLKTGVSRYVSAPVLEQILNSDSLTNLEGKRRKVTILFSDIRHFTLLAEQLAPEQVVSLLNEYFEVMLEPIFRNYGMLDKYIGDGIMAEFGALLEDVDQELHAVKAAVEMQEALQKLCQKWEREGKPGFKMGIGIHTGQAIVGNVGSEQRMEYTAIGDAVNVASRLEHANKTLNTSILISEETQKGLHGHFPLKNLGPVLLPGRAEPIVVYTILSDR